MFFSCVYGENGWPILNYHISYKPPSYWRVLFSSGGHFRQFSCMKKFRYLVVPRGGCCKKKILQGIQLKHTFSYGRWSFLIRKLDLMGSSVHTSRPRNSSYEKTDIWNIYETKHPHLPILRHRQLPQGPAVQPHYIWHNLQNCASFLGVHFRKTTREAPFHFCRIPIKKTLKY